MTLTLYHGPPSENFLAKKLEVLQNSRENIVIVPNSTAADQLKKQWLSQINLPLFGSEIYTWNDCLLKLIKRNTHRGHFADQELCHYLVFLCSQNLCQDEKFTFQDIADLTEWFMNAKKTGFNTSTSPFPKKYTEFFELYQKQLKKVFHYDEGDLYHDTILGFQKNSWKFFKGIGQLVVSDSYPLDLSQREFLKTITRHCPDLDIQVFYPADFSKESDKLSESFEEMGEIANETYFIPSEKEQHSISEVIFSNPYDEIQFVTDQIKSAIEKKSSPHDFAILCLNNQNDLITNALMAENIPIAQTLKTKDTLITLSESLEKTSPYYAQRRRIQVELENFNERQKFLENLFSTLRTKDKRFQELEQKFFYESFENSTLSARNKNTAVHLCTLNEALFLENKTIFIPGFYLENLVVSKQPTLFQNLQPILSQLHKRPSDQFFILKEKIDHLLKTHKNIVVSKSKIDEAGKETTDIPLDGINTKELDFEIKDSQLNKVKQDQKHFEQKKKNSYSITELQSYLNCPYQYYHRYVLEIEGIPEESIEPQPAEKGQWVHEALHLFFKNSKADYINWLQNKLNEKNLQKSIKSSIEISLEKVESDLKDHPELTQQLSKRVYSTIFSLFEKEKKLYDDQKKRSLPTLFEWQIPDFKIQTSDGDKKITGRIDRVDINPDEGEFTIIDYKTGTPDSLSTIKAGQSIQLPFYSLAFAQSSAKPIRLSANLYYNLKDCTIEGFSLSQTQDQSMLHKRRQISAENYDELHNKTLEIISNTVTKIQNQEFTAKPNDEMLCQYCDYRRACSYKEEM